MVCQLLQHRLNGRSAMGISGRVQPGIENKIQHHTSASVFVQVLQDLLLTVRQILIKQTKAQFDVANQLIDVLLLSHFLAQSATAVVSVKESPEFVECLLGQGLGAVCMAQAPNLSCMNRFYSI